MGNRQPRLTERGVYEIAASTEICGVRAWHSCHLSHQRVAYMLGRIRWLEWRRGLSVVVVEAKTGPLHDSRWQHAVERQQRIQCVDIKHIGAAILLSPPPLPALGAKR